MPSPSIVSRVTTQAFRVVSPIAFPDAWVECGDDRESLAKVAKRRRRGDGPFPSAVLRRRWDHEESTVAGHPLHRLTHRREVRSHELFVLHGGAYVVGPSSLEIIMAARLADQLGCNVSIFDYPKVPEHTAATVLPAVRAAWDHICDGRDPTSIVISGHSAGGGLAISLAAAITAEAAGRPGALILVSPWLDLTLSHPEAPAYDTRDRLLRLACLRRDGELFAGDLDPDDPLLSARSRSTESLAALPPTHLTVGEDELFLPESTELVDRVRAGGGDWHLHVEPAGQHMGALGFTPEAAAIRNTIADSLGMGP